MENQTYCPAAEKYVTFKQFSTFIAECLSKKETEKKKKTISYLVQVQVGLTLKTVPKE